MSSTEIDLNALEDMRVQDLKPLLKERGLSQVGKKQELVDRLREAIEQERRQAQVEQSGTEVQAALETVVPDGATVTAAVTEESAEVLADNTASAVALPPAAGIEKVATPPQSHSQEEKQDKPQDVEMAERSAQPAQKRKREDSNGSQSTEASASLGDRVIEEHNEERISKRRRVDDDEASSAAPAGASQRDTICVTGFSEKTSSESLENFVSHRTGKIIDFYVDDTRTKCFIQFDDAAMASRTVQTLDGASLQGDKLRVDYSDSLEMKRVIAHDAMMRKKGQRSHQREQSPVAPPQQPAASAS